MDEVKITCRVAILRIGDLNLSLVKNEAVFVDAQRAFCSVDLNHAKNQGLVEVKDVRRSLAAQEGTKSGSVVPAPVNHVAPWGSFRPNPSRDTRLTEEFKSLKQENAALREEVAEIRALLTEIQGSLEGGKKTSRTKKSE